MPDTSLYMFLSCSCMFKSIKVHGLAIYCCNLKPNTGQRENKITFCYFFFKIMFALVYSLARYFGF